MPWGLARAPTPGCRHTAQPPVHPVRDERTTTDTDPTLYRRKGSIDDPGCPLSSTSSPYGRTQCPRQGGGRHHRPLATASALDHPSCSSCATSTPPSSGTTGSWAWPACASTKWRRGEAPFPSLRVTEETIIDLVPGLDDLGLAGHLDHICLVVDRAGLDAPRIDPDLEVVDLGPRFGAWGLAERSYVRHFDGLLVEFRTYDV